ncbi:MAG: hypothetical protein ACLQVL_00990 [Terriglobia bacterium]
MGEAADVLSQLPPYARAAWQHIALAVNDRLARKMRGLRINNPGQAVRPYNASPCNAFDPEGVGSKVAQGEEDDAVTLGRKSDE